MKGERKTKIKRVYKKWGKELEIIGKNGEYTEYEEFHNEKQVNKIFKILVFLSILSSLIIIFRNQDICNDVKYAECGISYFIGNGIVFFILLWLDNILVVVFSLYKIFCGIMDKKVKEIIVGILCILIQPIIWENIFKMLNIMW